MIPDVFSGPFCISDLLGQRSFCDLLIFQINPFTHSHIVGIAPAFSEWALTVLYSKEPWNKSNFLFVRASGHV